MTERPEITDYAVKLTVHPKDGGGCWLEPDQVYNFEIQNEDEIHMLRSLPAGERMSLLFTLASAGAEIRALSIGPTSEEARDGKQTLDTGGEYYGATPFGISPGPDGGAVLTVVNDPAQERYHGERWFFDIWTSGIGAPRGRLDPKIYNKGDGSPVTQSG